MARIEVTPEQLESGLMKGEHVPSYMAQVPDPLKEECLEGMCHDLAKGPVPGISP